VIEKTILSIGWRIFAPRILHPVEPYRQQRRSNFHLTTPHLVTCKWPF